MAAQELKIPSRRSKHLILLSELDSEISSFLPHYRTLGDYFLPRRPRLNVTDVNRGDGRNQKLIDSTGTFAVSTLRAGMMGGVTSPARRWVNLTTPDPDMADYGPVKEWLHIVANRMSSVFLRSNLYKHLPQIYGDMSVFATSAMIIEKDFRRVLRVTSFPVGSYRIACGIDGNVNTFSRSFRMTVRQIVDRFGRKNEQTGAADWSPISKHVRNLWDNGQYQEWIDVAHIIKPNDFHDPRSSLDKFKRFESCYFERGGSSRGNGYMNEGENQYLRESGYDYFPVLAPRWEVNGEDDYGTSCPGMIVLGDNLQLQQGERRIAEGIDKLMRPPMTGGSSLRDQALNTLPGGMTFEDLREGNKGFRPAYQIDPPIQEMEGKQEQVRGRINRAFFVDLFLALTSTNRRQITAREVDEVHEEKLLQLGPVLEQINQDGLDPLVDITFALMLERGQIPPPPPELQGMALKTEYVSIMAQAQKLVGIGSSERFMNTMINMAAALPQVMDKVNADEWVNDYGARLGVAPKIIRSDQVADEMRAQAAQAAQARAQIEMTREAAGAARDLSQASTKGDNVLAQLINDARAGSVEAAV